MDTPYQLTHLSLCAGYGGIDLGLRRVIQGLRTIALSEIEAFACANLVAKMEEGLLDAAPIWTDLKTFPWESFNGQVDILSGGFPCQPFSAAGKRSGDEDARHLFPYILRGIVECKPGLVFLENVEGIVSAKLSGTDWRDPAGTPVLLHVLRELERVGYRATAGVFSSAEIGASHQRKRVFILAMANAESERGLSTQFSRQWSRSLLGSTAGATRPMPPGTDQWWWEPNRTIDNKSDNLDDTGGTESNGLSSEQRKEDTSSRESSGFMGDATQRDECGQQGSGVETGREADKGRTTNNHLINRSGKDSLSMDDPSVMRMERERSEQQTAGTMQSGQLGNAQQSGLERFPQCGDGRAEEFTSGYNEDERIGEIEPALGRGSNGCSDWLDYTKLCSTVDNRTDELRLLGNGVDPDVAAKAFVTLYNRFVK